MPRFFERGDPAERQQRDLEAKLKGKIDQRDAKGVQLQAAETKLAEARTLVEQLALDADEAALDRALQARRGAEDKLAALRGAAMRIGEEIALVEMAIDKVVDQRVRHETSEAVTEMAGRLAKAQTSHEAAALELELAAKEARILIPESVAVHQFVLSAREQLKPAIAMVTASLGAHARAVLSGHAPASLPRPAPPPPVLTVVPQEPMVTLYVTKNIRYLDASGATVCCGQNRRHDLPEHIGKLAIDASAAITLAGNKTRIATFEGSNSMLVPLAENCMWVGKAGKPDAPRLMRPGGAPIHSQFEPMDRGKPYVATFSRPPEPVPMPLAVGARADEGGES